MSMPAGWKRHNDYSIRRAGWWITKNFTDGATLYTLFGEDGTRYGHYESAEEAAAMAKSLDLAMTV